MHVVGGVVTVNAVTTIVFLNLKTGNNINTEFAEGWVNQLQPYLTKLLWEDLPDESVQGELLVFPHAEVVEV